ncbi:MAG TPA: single-stranded DNA-binding protein [Caproicibacter sp.]|nr:single-stranded DNA-binding protein [Caproicibacter sp.]
MLNVVAETGRLVSTPELKHNTKQDKSVAYTKFRIAVDRDYKQEGKDRITDFFDVICWRGTAENVCKNFKKGQLITIKGALQSNTYTDTNKVKHSVVEIVAECVYYAEQKSSSVGANQ